MNLLLGAFLFLQPTYVFMFCCAVDDYFLSRLPIVEKRLAQCGIRLAATLNRIFASQPKISLKHEDKRVEKTTPVDYIEWSPLQQFS